MGMFIKTTLGSSCASEKSHIPGDSSCFCGRYLFRFLDEEVVVRILGGPSGGGFIRGTLTKIDPKSGVFIVRSSDNGSPVLHHICCKDVSSIEQTLLTNGND